MYMSHSKFVTLYVQVVVFYLHLSMTIPWMWENEVKYTIWSIVSNYIRASVECTPKIVGENNTHFLCNVCFVYQQGGAYYCIDKILQNNKLWTVQLDIHLIHASLSRLVSEMVGTWRDRTPAINNVQHKLEYEKTDIS